MKEFDRLIEIADILLGPNGCAWDKEQTPFTLQPYILEEAHEVIEAIDTKDPSKIREEAGDLFYTIIFLAKLAEMQKSFSVPELLNEAAEKLIRRHPHIFSENKSSDIEEIKKNWEQIKKSEKGHKDRKSALDGIPHSLPLLAKAQKIMKKMQLEENSFKTNGEELEEKLGVKLLAIIYEIDQADLDAESILRRILSKYEQKFRKDEKITGDNLQHKTFP